MVTVTPKIGGIHNTVAWTGGTPDELWTVSSLNSPRTPYCYRLEDPAKSLRMYTYLTTSRGKKLERDDATYSFADYSDDASTHMEQCGMDSIFCLSDPCNHGSMLSLFQYHSRFTKTDVFDEVKDKNQSQNTGHGSYDKWDRQNLEMSKVWLLDSLGDTLKAALHPQLLPHLTGPDVYMLIVSEVQSDSIHSMRLKERSLEKVALSSYTLENVKAMNVHVVTVCNELWRGGVLPQDIILTVIDKYTKATCEEFRIHFLSRRSAVESYLKSITGKDESVIMALPDRITYMSLVSEANEKYQSLVDADLWMKASTDKGAAPAVYMTQADVEGLLKQQGDGNNKSGGPAGGNFANITCFNCGKKGHIATKCPHAATGNVTTPNGPAMTGSRAWITIAPSAGATETQERGNRTWNWCGTCARWTTTHKTATHVSKPRTDAVAAVAIAPSMTEAPAANSEQVSSSLFPNAGNYGAW